MLAIACAGKNLQMREMLADQFRGLHRRFDVVDGEHEHFCILGMGGTQQFEPRGVAVENLIAETAQKIHLSLAGLERREGNLAGAQNPADDLAEAPEARDNNL